MARNLAAKLASDGTASACDENHLVADISHYLVQIDANRVTAQKILYLHFPKLLHTDVTVEKLENSRKNFQLAICFTADFQNLFDFLCRSGRCRHIYFINLVLFN